MRIALTIMLLVPMLAVAFEVEKRDSSPIQHLDQLDVITIDGTAFVFAPYPTNNGDLELFAEIPERFKGPMSRLSTGLPITEDEVVKVLEAHFRDAAFDFDSMKVRNLTILGPRYLAWCTSYFATCLNHAFESGTLIEFEMNGRNRLGGVTGFEKERYFITKLPSTDTWAVTRAVQQSSGRLPSPTSDELKKLLNEGLLVEAKGSNESVFPAVRSVLEESGYTLETGSSDPVTIYTMPRLIKLTKIMADCGKVLGLSNIGDKRAETTVLVAVSSSDNTTRIRVAVGGIMRISTPFGSGYADNALTCTSTGVLEQDIATKILARLQ